MREAYIAFLNSNFLSNPYLILNNPQRSLNLVLKALNMSASQFPGCLAGIELTLMF